MKWCDECGSWGDHFRAEHPKQDLQAPPDDSVGGADGLVAAFDAPDEAAEVLGQEEDDVSDGAFARLRLAGLL